MKKSLLVIIVIILQTQVFAQENTCFKEKEYRANWVFLGPKHNTHQLSNQNFGAINAISVNPKDSNEIYLGSMSSGLFYTNNRGTTWQCLTDVSDWPISGISHILVDYNKKPHRIILATGMDDGRYDNGNFGVLLSENGGATWENPMQKSFNKLFLLPIRKLYDYKNGILALIHNSLYFSSDNAKTWSVFLSEKTALEKGILDNRLLRDVIINPINQNIFLSTNQRGTDIGLLHGEFLEYDVKKNKIINHTSLLDSIFWKKEGREGIQLVALQDSILCLASGHHGVNITEIYYYNIYTKKIVDYELGQKADFSFSYRYGLVKHPFVKKLFYAFGNIMQISKNGGESYQNVYPYSFGENNVPHADVRSIFVAEFSLDGLHDKIYLGTDGGLSYSNNSGLTWVNLNGNELPITQFYGIGTSPFSGIISGGTQDNSIMSYNPKNGEWLIDIRGDGYDVAYSKTQKGLLYGCYNSRTMYASFNDIAPLSHYMNLGAKENSENSKNIYTHSNGNLYFAGDHLYILEKGEKKWRTIHTPLEHHAMAFAVSETNPQIIYISNLWSRLYKSNDGGENWEEIVDFYLGDRNMKGARIRSIVISPYDPENIWLSFGYKGHYEDICNASPRVIFSKNGGRSWEDVSQGLPIFSVQDLKFYEGSYDALFAATEQGVYYKKGMGYNWKLYSDNLPKVVIPEIEINYCRGKIVAGTLGRGLWESDLPPIESKNQLILSGKNSWESENDEPKIVTRDIFLRNKATLYINQEVHIPKNARIIVKRKNQIKFGPKGKIINGCGESWNGIQEK